jgi:hypothetical protein
MCKVSATISAVSEGVCDMTAKFLCTYTCLLTHSIQLKRNGKGDVILVWPDKVEHKAELYGYEWSMMQKYYNG